MVKVIGPRDRKAANDPTVINTTSRSNHWSRGLSPFYLGPVELYGGHVSLNFENAWQYAKVYEEDADDGEPSSRYWEWALAGWASEKAHRYPKGKGRKPLYSLWDGEKLSYVEARKKIYIPLYAREVRKTSAFAHLKMLHDMDDVVLWDFDGYDHRKLGMSYDDVINSETRKCGHGFVLAMMLEGLL
jgi:hypothetical protein